MKLAKCCMQNSLHALCWGHAALQDEACYVLHAELRARAVLGPCCTIQPSHQERASKAVTRGHLPNMLCLQHSKPVSLHGVLNHSSMLLQKVVRTKEITAQSGHHAQFGWRA
jgi:hypothetical protein